jgi:hypothetical protein
MQSRNIKEGTKQREYWDIISYASDKSIKRVVWRTPD